MKIRKVDPNANWSKPLFGANAWAYDREAVLYLSVVNLRTFFGECFVNTEVGVKWLQRVMVKPANEQEAVAEVKRVLLNTNGVNRLYSFDYKFDVQARVFSFSYKLVTDYDVTDSGQLIDDFDTENYDAIYNQNSDTSEQWWILGISKLNVNTRLYR